MKKRQLLNVTYVLTGMLVMNFMFGTVYNENVNAANAETVSAGEVSAGNISTVSNNNSISGNGITKDHYAVSEGDIIGENVEKETNQGVLIRYTESDINVIPDKYNTGAKGVLTPVEIGQMVGDIQFAAGSDSTINVLDFVYRNTDISGTITFENMDFSKYKFAIYNDTKMDRDVKIIFDNCKFSSVSIGKGNGSVTCEFNRCTIKNFHGGNAVLNYCQFGQSYLDGVVPFQNVQVNNCLFYDMTSEIATGKEHHIDGTQIYGAEGIDVINVSYNNCRFEIPSVGNEGSTAYVNACIMLQMEYSNADGIRFNNCIVNGGGYSIYAWSKYDEYVLRNISFDNIKIGCAKKYGAFYSKMSPNVAINNVSETDSLYIGSVWKENGNTHLSVTNDTNQERILTIYTDKGKYEQVIPACPKGNQLTSSLQYSDFPFDIDIEIEADCGYVMCFDTTTRGFAKQVRFVNWQNENVYLEQEIADVLLTQQVEVIVYGKCGDEVDYALTNTGILTLSGRGATYSYHSGKPAPWSEYASYIKVIQIEPGVESLGNQLFANCGGVIEVSLPEGLLSIGSRTFAGCACLTEIVLPGTLRSVGEVAFSSSVLQKVEYKGTDWSQVQLGEGNEVLTDRMVVNQSPVVPPEEPEEPEPGEPEEPEEPEPSEPEEPEEPEPSEPEEPEEPEPSEPEEPEELEPSEPEEPEEPEPSVPEEPEEPELSEPEEPEEPEPSEPEEPEEPEPSEPEEPEEPEPSEAEEPEEPEPSEPEEPEEPEPSEPEEPEPSEPEEPEEPEPSEPEETESGEGTKKEQGGASVEKPTEETQESDKGAEKPQTSPKTYDDGFGAMEKSELDSEHLIVIAIMLLLLVGACGCIAYGIFEMKR